MHCESWDTDINSINPKLTRSNWPNRATTGHIRADHKSLNRLSSLAQALMELGYKPHLPLASAEEQGRQHERRDSMKRLGVAGLGMMQVMMYAVGLYAGDAFGIAVAERSFLEC